MDKLLCFLVIISCLCTMDVSVGRDVNKGMSSTENEFMQVVVGDGRVCKINVSGRIQQKQSVEVFYKVTDVSDAAKNNITDYRILYYVFFRIPGVVTFFNDDSDSSTLDKLQKFWNFVRRNGNGLYVTPVGSSSITSKHLVLFDSRDARALFLRMFYTADTDQNNRLKNIITKTGFNGSKWELIRRTSLRESLQACLEIMLQINSGEDKVTENEIYDNVRKPRKSYKDLLIWIQNRLIAERDAADKFYTDVMSELQNEMTKAEVCEVQTEENPRKKLRR